MDADIFDTHGIEMTEEQVKQVEATRHSHETIMRAIKASMEQAKESGLGASDGICAVLSGLTMAFGDTLFVAVRDGPERRDKIEQALTAMCTKAGEWANLRFDHPGRFDDPSTNAQDEEAEH